MTDRKAKSYYLPTDLTASIASEARKLSVKEDRRVTESELVEKVLRKAFLKKGK